MAAAVVTPSNAPVHDVEAYAFTAINATDGMYIDYTGVDHRICLLFANSSSSAVGEVIVEQGDGLQAVADLELTIPASGTVAATLESGHFKITDGASDYKGHVHITGPATVSVAAVAVV